MSLKPTLTLYTGASVASTGGTALDFKPSSLPTANGITLIVPDDDYQTRRKAIFQHKPAVFSAGRGWSNDWKKAQAILPTLDADNVVHLNAVRTEFLEHPTMSASERILLRELHIQMLVSEQLADFLAFGTTE